MESPRIQGRRVLVTGGAGFIGSHLVDALLRREAGEVVAVDNLFLGRRENLADALAADPPAVFYEQDAADVDAMADIFQRHRTEVVFNLAVVPLPASLERPKWSVDQNVAIATTLCELGRRGLYETLIEFSSSEALGTAQRTPMDEQHPLAPTTPYAASKAATDLITLSYVRTFGLDASILRPFNNFGPRQNDRAYAGIIPIVINRVLAGAPVEVFGDGEQTRDFIYAADTAEAAIDMYECSASRGRVTNVASGAETSVNTLVRTLLELLGRPDHPVRHGPPRPGDVRRHLADVSCARALWGFSPVTPLREGLRRTVEWYLARRGSA
jgi:UDP-glucose 4-epimerase